MKIAVITSLYHPFSMFGAEVVAETIALGLKKQGHDVFVITTKPLFSSLKKEDFIDGLKVIRFFPLNLFWKGNLSRYNIFTRLIWHLVDTINIFSYWQVRKILKKEKPDLVLAHNIKGMGYLIPIASKSCHCRFIQTVHDVQLITPSGLIIYGQENSFEHRNIFTKFYRFLNRLIFSSCDAIIFPSNYLRSIYEQYGFFKNVKKVVRLNPVADFLVALPEKKKKEQINFLYLGQISAHKSTDFLIDVFQSLTKKYSDKFKLYLVGDGALLPALKERTKGDHRFVFHGYIQRDKLIDIFSQIDMTIFTSNCYENLPTAIIDSFCFKVPVLATNIGGVSDLVIDGKNGFLFSPNDQEKLKEKLELILTQPEILDDLVKNIDREKFSLEKYLKFLLEL